ncbi:fungal-specific transcription factor domain-containing protein [Hypoxylon rubiginosum]|uniref:Fungal-specific transcription factor domain-containing protein n=1 Tax=Hypoxylon rubiginosum TaxID=110542 RepID=A0ACB9YX84_9PEZI|nr:fungal-specific transcription factor domain-containing protein [Hypoxylon rubiginosum]
MGRFKGRNPLACTNCRSQKVKCTGHRPCERCQSRSRECIYPARDPIRSIPESYLRNLQGELFDLRQRVEHGPRNDSNGQISGEPVSAGAINFRRKPLDECSAETFVETLRRLSVSVPDNGPTGTFREVSSGLSAVSYTYSRLNYDSMRLDVSFKLPPRPYAFHLLDTFEEGFCEYHWHLRKDFRDRLGLTYSDPSSQAEDRNWLCRVSVVLALAETYYRSKVGRSDYDLRRDTSSSRTDSMHFQANLTVPSTDEGASDLPPPGAEMFEQGLLLLKISPEEPTVEDVEVLNLIAFYSYCLNRKKTAYFYAAQSIRLAQVLRLHESAMSLDVGSQENSCIHEHQKRTWWTTYCIDRITSTELGLRPIINDLPLVPPSSTQLAPEDKDQFSNPHLLFALAQLCFIKGKVIDAVGQLQKYSLANTLKILRPCLTLLNDWMTGLPEDMTFTFEQGIPLQMQRHPYARNVASLYLRHNQCLILLLRPLLVRELPFIIRRGKETANVVSDSPTSTTDLSQLDQMNQSLITKCVSAARDNAKILVGLWRIEKIAKYGYWESLHLFSSLAILSLSRVFPAVSPNASTAEASTSNHLRDSFGIPETSSSPASIPVSRDEGCLSVVDCDSALYSRARDLLVNMGQVGSLSARDHERMLVDVEEMTNRMLAIQDGTGATPAEADFSEQPPGTTQPTLEGMIDEQIWYEMDWETIMRNPITWD